MATNYEQDGKKMYLETAASAESSDPMVLGDFLPVVLLKNADADDSNKAVVQTEGVFNLSVQAVDDDGNSAVSKYDALYYTSGDDPVLSKKSSGKFFGVALGDITSGSTDTIKVMLRPKAGIGGVDEDSLASSLQDRMPTLDLSYTDDEDGTADVTIQAQDAGGNDLAENVLVRIWTGGADDFGTDAITGMSVTTGTEKEEVAANAEYLVITDDTGKAVLDMDNDGAGTIYVWAELGGVVHQLEVEITA